MFWTKFILFFRWNYIILDNKEQTNTNPHKYVVYKPTTNWYHGGICIFPSLRQFFFPAKNGLSHILPDTTIMNNIFSLGNLGWENDLAKIRANFFFSFVKYLSPPKENDLAKIGTILFFSTPPPPCRRSITIIILILHAPPDINLSLPK